MINHLSSISKGDHNTYKKGIAKMDTKNKLQFTDIYKIQRYKDMWSMLKVQHL